MPIMTGALTSNAGRLAAGDLMSVANIVEGGQYGFGNHIPNIDAATPLVLRPIVPVITHVPTMFQYLTDFPETLKALVERHTTRIDGIDLQYTLEDATVPSGQDGQELHMPTNARRAAISPSMAMPEIAGNLVWNFFTYWMRLIKDPDTQASSLAGVIPTGTTLQPHVMSMFTMDMLVIQYDTTLQPQNIIDAYFIVTMWPYDAGPAGYTKQLGNSEHQERTIQFHGVIQHNRNTRVIGQNIATVLKLHTYDYNFAVPAATDVESRVQGDGVAHEAAEIASTFVPLGGNAAIG